VGLDGRLPVASVNVLDDFLSERGDLIAAGVGGGDFGRGGAAEDAGAVEAPFGFEGLLAGVVV